jgi:hypothetical protein
MHVATWICSGGREGKRTVVHQLLRKKAETGDLFNNFGLRLD